MPPGLTATASNAISRPASSGCAARNDSAARLTRRAFSRPDGLERVTEAVPAAHLDLAEDEPAPSPHDEIQLVAARPGIGGEHAIPAQHVEAAHPPLGGRAGRVHGTTAARLRVAERLERPAVQRAGAALAHDRRVSRRDVADMGGEAERRVESIEASHRPVTDDLRHHRRGCDSGALLVAVDDGAVRGRRRAEPEAVDEPHVGLARRRGAPRPGP